MFFPKLSIQLGYPFIGQAIGPFVAMISGMPLHPNPFDTVLLNGLIQATPQIFIFHGFVCRGFPSPFLPIAHPFGNAVQHIFGVGMQPDLAGAVERFQSLYRRRQLHAVIGGFSLPSPKLFFFAFILQAHPPAAGARITFTSTIGIYRNNLSHVDFLSRVSLILSPGSRLQI